MSNAFAVSALRSSETRQSHQVPTCGGPQNSVAGRPLEEALETPQEWRKSYVAVDGGRVSAEARRTAHPNGHVEFKQAYHSVPPEFVGRQVWVRAGVALASPSTSLSPTGPGLCFGREVFPTSWHSKFLRKRLVDI